MINPSFFIIIIFITKSVICLCLNFKFCFIQNIKVIPLLHIKLKRRDLYYAPCFDIFSSD